MDTNIKVKEKYIPFIFDKVLSRLRRGREKYSLKLDDSKEASDLLKEEDPIYQLISAKKYLSEYINTGEAKCLYDAIGSICIQALQDWEKIKNK